VAKARSCLLRKRLRVSGGPGPGQGAAGEESADGELIVGDGTGGAIIGFYPGPATSRILEPEVAANVARLGGHVERRGAEIVWWTRSPVASLLADIRACVPA